MQNPCKWSQNDIECNNKWEAKRNKKICKNITLFPLLTGDNIKISINECVSDVPISKRQAIFNGF